MGPEARRLRGMVRQYVRLGKFIDINTPPNYLPLIKDFLSVFDIIYSLYFFL